MELIQYLYEQHTFKNTILTDCTELHSCQTSRLSFNWIINAHRRQIWSHLLKKSLMENFIFFCSVWFGVVSKLLKYDEWSQLELFIDLVFFQRCWQCTRQQGKGGGISLLPGTFTTRKHSKIYVQICIWDGYRAFSIAALVFTGQVLDEIYHL